MEIVTSGRALVGERAKPQNCYRQLPQLLNFTHSFLFTRSFCSCFIKNAPRFARRSNGTNKSMLVNDLEGNMQHDQEEITKHLESKKNAGNETRASGDSGNYFKRRFSGGNKIGDNQLGLSESAQPRSEAGSELDGKGSEIEAKLESSFAHLRERKR